MEKKRSVGVTILSWLYIVGGLLSVLSVFTGKGSYAVWGKIMPLYLWIFYMIVTFLLGMSGFVVAVCALKLISWARKVIITVAIGNLIILAITAASTPKLIQDLGIRKSPLFLTVVTILIPMLFFLVSIYYFTRPKVKEQFK